MHFYRMLEEMPRYTGVGLPASAAFPPNTIRMDDILDLSKAFSQGPGRCNSGPVCASPLVWDWECSQGSSR
jgi:hypothetical protein